MKQDSTFLAAILAAKREDLAARKSSKSYAQLEKELESAKPFAGTGFFEALKAEEPTPKIIAEAKKASPSRGVIRGDFSLSQINDAYQAAPNVAAISVLTEKDHFGGSDETLAFFAAHNTHAKPLLRKDFIFDPYQVLESKLLGAQAFLLIVAMLDAETLNVLVDLGRSIGIEPLVEAHDKRELELAKSTNARVIGVNCRDLKTFSLNLKAHELLRDLDDSYARIAESGVENPEYLRYVSTFSDAVLIGSHFMSQPDIGGAIESMVAS